MIEFRVFDLIGFVAVLRFVRVLVAAGMLAASAGCDRGDNEGPLNPETRVQIDRLVEQQMQAEGLPGAVVGVWVGSQSHVTVRGVANIETGRTRAADDPFRIASVTKSFTGTAAMILIDRGQLSKTDTLDQWYPGFPNAGRITVGDLLRMRSGIADSADSAFLAEYWANPLLRLDAEAMIARSAARGAEFIEPDSVTRYTNVNFILLERIVEKVSGTDIRRFLATNIYEPLRLRHTAYPTDSQMPGLLRGYGRKSDAEPLEDRTQVNPVPAGGAGAMISDLEDLRLYTRALCRGDLLKADTQAQRLQPTRLENEPEFVGYGEGLARLGQFCGHNGTIFGFSTEVWYLPEADATFVVSVNRLDLDDKSKSFNTFALVSRLLFPTLVSW